MNGDVHGAMQAWQAHTVPAEATDHSMLAYRWFGHVRAVLEAESAYLVLMRIDTDRDWRGQGEASAVLEWLKALCDCHGVTLLGQANVDDESGLGQTALLHWYARHGFRIDDSHQGEPLVWYPEKPGTPGQRPDPGNP
ncbi:N-acetyltransferase [Spiribacter onubensis]|uniref:GNAT family N-acetyltransferase n=1 Tax=Spiribacter onubensis TaxID=3122420 RepID=A0ABV3S6T0_9GAMM